MPLRSLCLELQRDGLCRCRAFAVADFAAQALEIETGFLVDQRGQAHAGIIDVGQSRIEGAGRAGRHAWNVLAHFTGDVTRGEIGSPEHHVVAEGGELQRIVRAVTHT